MKILNAEQLGADPKLIGLAGSPTILFKVEKIPKGKAGRQAEVIDGSSKEEMVRVVARLRQALSTMVIK